MQPDLLLDSLAHDREEGVPRVEVHSREGEQQVRQRLRLDLQPAAAPRLGAGLRSERGLLICVNTCTTIAGAVCAHRCQ